MIVLKFLVGWFLLAILLFVLLKVFGLFPKEKS
jgi:hypothetical protein